MRVKFGVVGLCVAAIALTTFGASPADAAQNQNQKKKAATTTKKAPATKRVATKSPSARITVQRRSFLDPGTEVLPGSGKTTDYAVPPAYSPQQVIENRAGVFRSPLPGPFDLPSRYNPWPWNW
jgi:hypothetical protein